MSVCSIMLFNVKSKIATVQSLTVFCLLMQFILTYAVEVLFLFSLLIICIKLLKKNTKVKAFLISYLVMYKKSRKNATGIYLCFFVQFSVKNRSYFFISFVASHMQFILKTKYVLFLFLFCLFCYFFKFWIFYVAFFLFCLFCSWTVFT